jgi:hypothetical protein
MPFPSHTRAINAFKKAGAEVRPHSRIKNGWVATKNGKSIEWFTQRGFPDETVLVVPSFCVAHPETDASVDLFMDTFYHTISSAVKAIA